MPLVDQQLVGFKELDAKLRALGASVGGKVLRAAAGNALTPVLKSARQNAPVGKRFHTTYKGTPVSPGFLQRNIKKRTAKSRNGQAAYAWVGVSGEAFYGILLDKGYRPGTRSKAVKKLSRKRGALSSNDLAAAGDARVEIRGTRWLTLALERNVDVVLSRFKAELKKRIDKVSR